MAKSMKAEVILLHVISDPVFYSTAGYSPIMGFEGYIDMTPMQLENVNGLKDASLHYLNKSKQHLGDNTIQTIVKEGDFADSILEAANEVGADIIVIGSHSRKWLENIVMGSVTEKVLHHTTIPLFIVPTRKSN
jgi:nucleotide-binding universal stress UspA family protein